MIDRQSPALAFGKTESCVYCRKEIRCTLSAQVSLEPSGGGGGPSEIDSGMYTESGTRQQPGRIASIVSRSRAPSPPPPRDTRADAKKAARGGARADAAHIQAVIRGQRAPNVATSSRRIVLELRALLRTGEWRHARHEASRRPLRTALAPHAFFVFPPFLVDRILALPSPTS